MKRALGLVVVLAGCTATPPAKPCTVVQSADGGAIIQCPDGSKATVQAGADGSAGTSCSIDVAADGTRSIVCDDGTTATLPDDAELTCSGSFDLRSDLDALALNGCDVIDGSLAITGAFSGTSLDPLVRLHSITHSLSIIDPPASLPDLHGLDNVTDVGGLLLNILKTQSADGLVGLARVDGGSFDVVGNPALEHLGLDALASVVIAPGGEVTIENNPLLPQCEVDAFLARTGAQCTTGHCGNNNDAAACH